MSAMKKEISGDREERKLTMWGGTDGEDSLG